MILKESTGKRVVQIGVAVLGIGAVLFACIWAVWSRYPYGWSHCCDKQLYIALLEYANDHGGKFPTGEATPEASLSLLYPKYAVAELLCGKSVPAEVAKAILERGERLGPETCGWHYVEGLTRSDDSRIAIFWDKARLGHNGELYSDHRTTVCFLGTDRVIADDEWEAFLEEQRALHTARRGK